jgi:hypothetical protein
MLGKVNHYVRRASVFLIMIALLVGMVGYGGTCDTYNPPPPSKNLEIRDWYDLDNIRDNLDGNYTLMNDLDSTTAGYDELASLTIHSEEYFGWQPIGTEDNPFTGTFDGQGYEIRDLFIDGMVNGESHAGIFRFIDEGGHVEDIGVVDAVVTSLEVAGGLVAVCYGAVTNSYSAASVDGHECAGGLVGLCYGNVTNSYSKGSVTSDACAGGLVGGSYGTVSNSYAMGNVIGGFVYVGGLLGLNDGTVTNSYATGSVTGYGLAIGGLVGSNGYEYSPGTVSDSYSTGSVTGEDYVGGLVGLNWPESIVNDCYATGNVDGEMEIGGLVGGNAGNVSNSYSIGNVTGYKYVGGLLGRHWEGTVDNSYSKGSVTGNMSIGGLVGYTDDGTVNDSFWDIETSGRSTSDGGTGKNTTEMKNIATFSSAGWNIIAVGDSGERNPTYIWNIVHNETYPFLSWQAI